MSARLLTAAEKRKATLEAKAAKELEDNVAFQNKSAAAGGRKAKKVANETAVWNLDKPASRKRTLSTVPVAAPAKKARDSEPVDSDVEESLEAEVKATKKRSMKSRKHAPPAIDFDDDEATHQAAKAGLGTKKKASTKVPQKAARKPAPKITAESASDASSPSNDDSGSESHSDDAAIAPQDLSLERPRIVSASAKGKPGKNTHEENAGSDDDSYELDDPQHLRPLRKMQHLRNASNLFDSDDEGSGGPGGAASDSDNSMPDAPPRNTRGDIELAEKIQDFLVDIPRGKQRRTSSMSSGMGTSVPASEIEMDDDEDVSADEVKKPRKVSAARQKQANAEKPSVRRGTQAAPHTVSDDDTSELPESAWHATARLVHPAHNRDIALTAQPQEAQFVLRGSIGGMKRDMYFHDMFPLIGTRAGFARPYLINAALVRPSSKHIHDRLVKDPGYGQALAPIPIDRINIVRGDVKRCAVTCAPAFYQLADLDTSETKSHVENLLKDHRYIFPSDKRTGGLQLNQPFCHNAIVFVMKEVFFAKTSFVTEHMNDFPATNPKKPDEREVPFPMVAIAATALYAALLEYRMTGARQPAPFTEDAFEDIYRTMSRPLKTVVQRRRKPVTRSCATSSTK
ncbi:hypothetical protein R3P38DRAFT_3016776 [Favolaschia claudopus]|uniref:DUF6532 domain-containing protein n=1 Tax=Favolaschia claudopus TaxID=2862362 RepID=A0AAW0AIR4_9AGAR